MKKLATLFYAIATWFMGVGFYKIFFYTNFETPILSKQNVNAYVGGDAYNYIINASYSTSYFVLALLFTILGCTTLILNKNKAILSNPRNLTNPTTTEVIQNAKEEGV